MFRWLRQLLCQHVWDQFTHENSWRVRQVRICDRCGKVEIRTGWG